MDDDNFDAAMPSVKLLNDVRIKHFYDNNKAVGKTIAESVAWAGNIAWDIYLFYEPFSEWKEKPPKPQFWMHQLIDDWAKNNNYRTGNDLKNGLLSAMNKLVNK